MGTYLIYALEVQCEGLLVQVLLNGVAVFDEPLGGNRFTQLKVNPTIVAGENQLEVLAGPRPGQEVAKDALLQVGIIKGPHGQRPGPDARVVDFQWNEGDQPLSPDQLTPVFQGLVPVDEGHGRWAWQDATPYAPADDGAIATLVTQAAQTLAAGDLPGYLGMLAVMHEEMSRALDIPIGELKSDLSTALGELLSADDWHVDPVDPSRLRYAPTAGGRLVRVTDDLGKAPLRGAGGGQTFETDLTVSKLGQSWTIVR